MDVAPGRFESHISSLLAPLRVESLVHGVGCSFSDVTTPIWLEEVDLAIIFRDLFRRCFNLSCTGDLIRSCLRWNLLLSHRSAGWPSDPFVTVSLLIR